jgi:Flavodoxin domain
MQAIVVYESHWGSTAKIARAIAEGIGPEARALTTSEATPEIVAEADLVVAGSPVMAFGLPSEGMIANAAEDLKAPVAADVSQPSLRSWLEQLHPGHGRAASFETRLRWSPLGATGAIDDRLRRAGFQPIAKPAKFVVTGPYGPLRDGEVERARAWGTSLAAALG